MRNSRFSQHSSVATLHPQGRITWHGTRLHHRGHGQGGYRRYAETGSITTTTADSSMNPTYGAAQAPRSRFTLVVTQIEVRAESLDLAFLPFNRNRSPGVMPTVLPVN